MKNYSISLYKSGKFYNAFGDDGIILHFLCGYKYVEYKKSVGFPESAFNKVKGILEENKLSYHVYDKTNNIENYKGINKNYPLILKKALSALEAENRVNRLKEKIENLKPEELEHLIEVIEDASF